MKTSFWQKLKKFIAEYSKYSHWHKVAVCMAAVVAVLTVSALILPAVTMGRDAYCGIEEHKHTAECYEKQLVCKKAENETENKTESKAVKMALSCPLELHQHKESCHNSNGEIICGYADYVVHQHSENCYDENGMLVCTLPEIKEHTHDASCYTEEKRLVCTIAETAGHTHTEDCYTMVETGNINCIAPEEEGHVHTEECFEKVKTLTCGQEEVPAHTHTDGCYETAKHCVCGKPEVILHKHDEIHCYSTDDNGNKYLSCGMLEVLSHEHDEKCFQEVQAEDEEHVHTEECYEEVVICEKTEHTHEDRCFDKKTAETEAAKQSESDNSAETAEIVETTETEQTVWTTQDNKSEINAAETECGKEEHTHTEACYSNNGDFICELEEHTHELACYPEEVQNKVNEVKQAIEALPTYDELNEKFAAYEEAGDEDGYNAYFQEISAQAKDAYEAYESLDAKLQKFIPAETVEALNSYASFLVMGTPESTGTADTDLSKYLQSVTLKDKDGNLINDTVYVGENYEISLGFSESEGKQFNTAVDTWTYQLPAGILVTAAQSQKMTITITENNIPKGYEVTYDISTGGLITIHPTPELKAAVDQSPNVSFNVQLDAKVSDENTGENGEIVFTGFDDNIKFNTSTRPTLSVEKKAEKPEEYKDDKGNSTGGKLTYTVTGHVQNGPIKGMTFTDKAGYAKDYFGDAAAIQENLKIDSVVINCENNTDGHGKTLEQKDYTFTWADNGAFTLKVNDMIQMDDCDTIEVTYHIPYTAAQGVNYYRFDVENTVTFDGTTVQPTTGPQKGDVKPDTASNSVRVTGGTTGIKGIVKSINGEDYDKTGLLHYTVKVDVKALNYKTFYLYDEMTVLLDGKTYKADVTPLNLRVKFTDANCVVSVITNLADIDNEWVYNIQKSEYKLPPKNYCSFLGKGVKGNFKAPGLFDIPFNPVWSSEWASHTSLELQTDSKIEITYDINVDEKINLYGKNNETDAETVVETVTLREYLARNDGAAILRNYIQLNAGGQWGGSKVDFSRGDKLRKTGVENADGTIDYSVTLLVDEAVRGVLKENTKQYDIGWGTYTGFNLDFYDQFPEGWEYVEGSLTATPNYGSWAPTFYYVDYFSEEQVENNRNNLNIITSNKVSPVAEGGNAINAAWNGFVEDKVNEDKVHVGMNYNWGLSRLTLTDNYMNVLIGVTFNYKLRPTERVGANASFNQTLNVHNEAAIRTEGKNLYTTSHDLTYEPKILSKTAKQNGEGSNVVSFEIDINQAGVDLVQNGTTISVTDTMGANLTLCPGSLSVTDTEGNVIPVTDYSMETKLIEGTDGKKQEQFTLKGLPDNRHLRICYDALITEQGDNIAISNKASIVGVAETKLDENTAFDVSNTSGSGQGSIDYFTLHKVDEDNVQKYLQGAEFNIYKATPDGNGKYTFGTGTGETKYSAKLIGNYTTDASGKIEVKNENVQAGQYYILEETEAPRGYIKPEKPILVYFAGAKEVPADVDKNAQVIGITYAFTVKNEAYKVELPETGGIGTIPYTMAGITLIVTAALVYINENKKTRANKK